MKTLRTIFLLVVATCSGYCQAQTSLDSIPPSLNPPTRMVAMNMTTLAHKLVPFNAQSVGLQSYAMQFRKKLRHGNTYFASSYGFSMGIVEGQEEPLHFDLRMGIENRKEFAQRWYFGSGYNVVLYAHELEEQNNFFGQDVETGVGFDKSFIIGYEFNEYISVFTESSFFFGVTNNFNGSLLRFEFLSPTSIYFNVKF